MRELAAILARGDFMHWSLVAIVVFLAALLLWCQLQDDDFDLRHLVAGANGKIDRYAFAFITGALFLTFGFVHYVIEGRADLWLFVGYGLVMMFPKVIDSVAAPIIAQRFGVALPAPAQPGGPTQ